MNRRWLFAALMAASIAAAVAAAGRDCHTHPWPYNNTLLPGESLGVGHFIASSTAYFIVEATGSAVVYQGKFPSTSQKLWSTNTDGAAAKMLTLTSDGNLVLMSVTSDAIWSSNTSNSSILVMQDNCDLAMYFEAPLTNQTWSANTRKCLNVHIVPHSHDDVGWLLTPERYYDGCYDPMGGVQSIISSMVEALAANSSRTFVQVESYFFNRWWDRQSETTRAKCREIVKRGQFSFINGGWSMHDEACVHQESAVSNMATGAQFLRDKFGYTSNLTIGWHIDPFGHASTTPRLMAQMGFNGFFFWRTDYEQKNFMIQTKTLETMWNSSPSLGDSVSMFTSILYNDYCVGCRVAGMGGFPMCPSSFCCYYCEQDRMPAWGQYFERVNAAHRRQTHVHHLARFFGVEEDKMMSNGLALSQLAQMFAANIKQYAVPFRTNNVLIPWGCDFEHIDANISFALMDDVMTAINADPSLGLNLFYSTPQRYLDAIEQLNYSWPVNEYDYFLDSDNGHAYWSGYFSSRAEYKRFERFLMNERASVELILSSVRRKDDIDLQNSRVQVLQRALGVAQHHDSITGTEREHVRDRYQFLLTEGLANASSVVADVLETVTGSATKACFLSNLSACPETDALASPNVNISVFVFNPVAWQRQEVIIIPVPTKDISTWVIQGGRAEPILSQIQTTWELTTSRDPTSPPHVSQPYELIVLLNMSSLSTTEIIISSDAGTASRANFVEGFDGASEISSNLHTATFDNRTGRLSAIKNVAEGIAVAIDQNIMSYCPMGPDMGQASGAYIFRTCTPDAVPIAYNETFRAQTFVGPLCSEVRQWINDHNLIHQRIRVCHGKFHVEMTTGIGAVDPGYTGVEVVMRLSTNLSSNDTWYTDSEGLELQQRIRNVHRNYPHVVTEPVASNFYPCNLMSLINSSDASLGVVADYSRATASLADGELEFLMIRRLLFDDNRGVAQPLNEDIRLISTSLLVAERKQPMQTLRREGVEHTRKPIVRFGQRSTKLWSNQHIPSLPPNIHLHTREQVADGVFLIRLQHIFALGEGPRAAPVTVDLQQVVPFNAQIVEVLETNINGVATLSDTNSQRQSFSTCDAASGKSRAAPTPFASSLVGNKSVLLVPMDIRTYLVVCNWV